MSFEFDPLTGAKFLRDGVVVWDSAAQHPVHFETVSGSFQIKLSNDLGARQLPVDVIETVVLKTGLSPLLTHVDGTAKLTWSGGPYAAFGVVDGSYHNIGGTVFIFGTEEIMNPSGAYTTYLTGFATFATAIAMTFKVSGGTLSVEIDRHVPGYGPDDPLPGGMGTMTVSYIAYLSTLNF